MFAIDTILQNRYRIIRPLGRGGMGAVYEALDERLSRTVALKETLVETDELRRAFEREARLLANLRHPALPKVLDHFSEGDGLFLVMEFIPGDDLAVMMERKERPFTPAEVLGFAYQILDALDYLHHLSPPVLHRDIKPANLKLLSPNHIVLLDFGLAKGSAGQMSVAESKSVHGYSPNYSPLEQMQGAGTDARSDLYSLGATLYHLLTNVKPVDALSRATALINGQPDPLRPANKLNPEVGLSLSAALMRAMALNVEHRPRSAAEMRDDLHNMAPRAASTVPVTAEDETTRVSLPPGRDDIGARDKVRERQIVVPLPEETVVARKHGGRKWVIAAVLIAALCIIPAALYLLLSGKETPRRTTSNRPVARSSPRPSPTPADNANRQENVNIPPVATPDEMAARARLSEKNIPFTETAFTRAVEEGETGAVELFLAAGMKPDVLDAGGRTALINAASRGSNNISEKLLRKGANVNAQDNSGSTALMQSALGGHEGTARVLLERGADVNLRDNNGQTALIYAAARGRAGIVRMLLNKGARVDVKDAQGRDALTWAENNKHSDVIELLKKAGAGRP
ncbi:MAG TPA: ankyrin repeat domain-containing protein [Pyrinomonadaceae bacterium]|nr:ankyrin repeat domain-containing protein [Pyrinomonadaceae bacterium]